jgi:hypothetical protein
VEDFDGLLDDDVPWHQDDGTSLDMGQVQCGELARTERQVSLHEMRLKGRAMGFQGFGKTDADDTGGQAGGVGIDERVVDEDKTRRALIQSLGGGERGGGLRRGRRLGGRMVGKFDFFGTRVAPVFILETRPGW